MGSLDILSAPVSLATTLINRHSQKETNKRNAEQNELNREFNSVEAQKQRAFEAQQAEIANKFASNEALEAFKRSSAFTKEMWNKQNDYDSPNAQIARLKEAGINPNLFGGDNTSASVGSVSSPSASSSMPHASSASAPSSIPLSAPTISNPLLESAQVRLANAQAKSLEHDTERKDDLHSIDVQTAKGNLRLIGLQGDLTAQQKLNLEQDAKLASKRCDEIDQNIAQSKEYERYMKLQGDSLEKENKYLEERLLKQLDILQAQYELEIANKKEVASRIVENLSQANLNNQLGKESKERQIGIVNQNYLDGVKVQVVKDNRRHFINMVYDVETSALELSSSQNKSETQKSNKDYRVHGMRNQDNWFNIGLDAMEILSQSVGAGFRVGFSLKQ